MPAAVEHALIRKALMKGWGKIKEGKTILTRRGRAFVYGTLHNKFHWTRGE